MRLTKSKTFKFRLQEYESMEVMASVTVDSADLGVSDEDRAKMSDAEAEQHYKDLSAYCMESLLLELRPELDTATRLCDRKSSAEDVDNYHKGLGA